MNNLEITYDKLPTLGGYTLIDIRAEEAYLRGHIPGAVNIPAERLGETALPAGTIVLCCRSGRSSLQAAYGLRLSGQKVLSLCGGYLGWVQGRIDGGDFALKAEEGLRGEFANRLFTPFAKAVAGYGLVCPNDCIAVCISGGKDSMLMAKLFQELKRHNKFPFELKFLVMDPGYARNNRLLIESNARKLGIPITVFSTDIFQNVYQIQNSPCYICARMRRGHLYAKAKELGCNKIALGHHYDDVIETILMGMLYGGQMQTMLPRIKSSNFEGMELIRPMYLVQERDIIAWREAYGLQFLRCACKFTNDCALDEASSKRQRVKRLISDLAKEDPQIRQNIFKSAFNVSLSTVMAYKDKQGIKHPFDEDF